LGTTGQLLRQGEKREEKRAGEVPLSADTSGKKDCTATVRGRRRGKGEGAFEKIGRERGEGRGKPPKDDGAILPPQWQLLQKRREDSPASRGFYFWSRERRTPGGGKGVREKNSMGRRSRQGRTRAPRPLHYDKKGWVIQRLFGPSNVEEGKRKGKGGWHWGKGKSMEFPSGRKRNRFLRWTPKGKNQRVLPPRHIRGEKASCQKGRDNPPIGRARKNPRRCWHHYQGKKKPPNSIRLDGGGKTVNSGRVTFVQERGKCKKGRASC